jgi:hypothetical protein
MVSILQNEWIAIIRSILIGWIIILIVGLLFPIPLLFLPIILPLIFGAVVLWFILGFFAQVMGLVKNVSGFAILEIALGGFTVGGLCLGFITVGGFILGVILIGAIAICFIVGYALSSSLKKNCKKNPDKGICKWIK